MLFNSLAYLIFLPAVVALYWLIPSRLRLPLLLAASYFFYMSWKAEYGLLLLALTLANFTFGFCVSKENKSQTTRRLCFVAALATNLATLALFKYTNFFIDTAWTGLNCINSVCHQNFITTAVAPNLPIILPLGISFFVFEFIHYIVDVYKGQQPIRNPVRFGLFAAFFPSQIAGPIKRFEDFDEQAGKKKEFDAALFQSGVILIVQGMFKKVVLGDNLAPLVAVGFTNCHQLNCLDSWAAVLSFTLQIYYDFSGYTDIGRGSANLLGYRLPENFNMPYIAKNVSEFWHRWHISLSTWLRDYLYIPLGGSRQGKLPQMRNLLITMLLGGLWHGASWTFVLWGLYQGIGLIVCHSWEAFASNFAVFRTDKLKPIWESLSRILTLVFVMFGWALFRAENMDQFQTIWQSMLGFASTQQTEYDFQVTRMFSESPLPLAFAIYSLAFLLQLLLQRHGSHERDKPSFPSFMSAKQSSWQKAGWWLNPPLSARVVLVATAACMILGFAPRTAVPFIYFQF